MRFVYVMALFALLTACGSRYTSPPPEEVVLNGDTARVPVLGNGDVRGHELENIRWKQPETQTKKWLVENGFEHLSTRFNTEKMQAIGYEALVSEDQTGVRLYGISIWTQQYSEE